MIEFAFDVAISDGVAVITLRGEADLAAAEQAGGAGAATIGNPAVRSVIVDCAQVTFCDSTMLGLLVGWHNNAQQVNCGFRLRAVPPMMRLLQITALETVFEIDPTQRHD